MRHEVTWVAKLLFMLVSACTWHKAPLPAPAVILPTERGAFSIQVFESSGEAKGLVIFGTGDGGSSYFEDRIARALADCGYAVVGWDCRAYAKLGPYGQPRLVADVRAAIAKGRELFQCDDVPVVLGGWSTGAEQMVAVAASPQRPEKMAGLLLLAPGERGRYGITITDLLGLTPRGADTFALTDLGKHLAGLRVLQFHGEEDGLDQTFWLKGLTIPHRLVNFPKSNHDFDGASPEFLDRLCREMGWLIHG